MTTCKTECHDVHIENGAQIDLLMYAIYMFSLHVRNRLVMLTQALHALTHVSISNH